MKEHKHADVIRAFADGKAIQYFNSSDGLWEDTKTPTFGIGVKYRVKPEEDKWKEVREHWERGGTIQYKKKVGSFTEERIMKWVDLHPCDDKYVAAINWDGLEWRIKPIAILDEEIQNSISEILGCMDFEKIKKVMDFLNWTWWNTDGVPEIYELRIFAREQLNRVAKGLIKSGKNRYATSCGGFVAEAERDDDDSKIYFNLSFVLTNWSNWE